MLLINLLAEIRQHALSSITGGLKIFPYVQIFYFVAQNGCIKMQNPNINTFYLRCARYAITDETQHNFW